MYKIFMYIIFIVGKAARDIFQNDQQEVSLVIQDCFSVIVL